MPRSRGVNDDVLLHCCMFRRASVQHCGPAFQIKMICCACVYWFHNREVAYNANKQQGRAFEQVQASVRDCLKVATSRHCDD